MGYWLKRIRLSEKDVTRDGDHEKSNDFGSLMISLVQTHYKPMSLRLM